MDDDITTLEQPFTRFTRRTFIGLILTGIVAGILIFILTLAIDRVVLQPAMCEGNDTAKTCAQSMVVSYHIASIITAIVAVIMLTRLSVYRPLLVGIATTIGLWKVFDSFLNDAVWPAQLLGLIVINILAYFAFTWLLRTYNLVISLVSTVALIIAMLVVTTL